MDTLEHRVTRRESGEYYVPPPILWKDKTAKQVQSENYPDRLLVKTSEDVRSTRADVDYCRAYSLRKGEGDNMFYMEAGETVSNLVEIDRR